MLIYYHCPRCKDNWPGDEWVTECPTCGNIRFDVQQIEPSKEIFNYSPPSPKPGLDRYERDRESKLIRVEHGEKIRGWIYDPQHFRTDARSGAYHVDAHRLYHHFENWMNDASIVYLRNVLTGERVRHLGPKRGNRAYAAKYRAKLNDLNTALACCKLDEPFGTSGKYYRTQALLVTFTYDHKDTSLQSSWGSVSKDLSKWKTQCKRKLGITDKNAFATLAIKEGTESGYPAPHMLILIKHPVIVVRHVGKKNGAVTWRIQSYPLLDALKSAWHKGFIDVQGIVKHKVSNGKDNVSVMRYLFKYLTKAVDLDLNEDPNNEIREKYKNIGIKTFAWQKYYMLRPLHISKAFKVFVRLDTAMHESQQWIYIFDHSDHCKLSDSGGVLNSRMPPDPYPWPGLSRMTLKTGKTLVQEALELSAKLLSEADAMGWKPPKSY
jgi:hypothetical protein